MQHFYSRAAIPVLVLLIAGCTNDPAPIASLKEVPLAVEAASVRRVEDHVVLLLDVNCTNKGATPLELKSPAISLTAGMTEVNEYRVPFTETVVIPPAGSGKGVLRYWLDQTMVDRELMLRFQENSILVKPSAPLPISQLLENEEKSLPPGSGSGAWSFSAPP